eukprot:GSChrysophyteH1.ASY1.ANO1.1363.1 assembled CDS
MPALSPTMTSGTIGKWLFSVGDKISPGDAIAEIETDKASMAFEAQDDLVIAKILVSEGAEVPVGSPIMVTVEDAESISAFADFEIAEVVQTPETRDTVPTSGKSQQRFSPAARYIVQSKNLDTSSVAGTSRGGRISKADIVQAIKSGKAVVVEEIDTTQLPPVNDNFIDIPNSNMRKVIARRLTESKATVPHMYATIECEIDDLLALRKKFSGDLQVNVSVNDLVIKAAALALRDHPDVRRKWDSVLSAVSDPEPCDIAVAVATPNGLITPIVTSADKRGCADINNTVKELAGRAKVGKLLPEEYSGGCFSISNLGMFGINSFSAVINPPQACILAVGSGSSRVFPPRDGEVEPHVATVLSVQLSADRRVVDEALASQFLETFRAYVSNPNKILL